MIDILEAWNGLKDIEVNPDDTISTDYLFWRKGTPKLDIWLWFDENTPNGLANFILDNTELKH